MNSREIVTRAIEFKTPERLPLVFPRFGLSDTHYVGWNQIGTGPREKKESLDEWGCLWVRSAVDNMGQVKGHPLSSWANLDTYRFPDPEDGAFYEGMERKFAGFEDKYYMTSIFMLLFERMHALRGFANILEDLYMERERAEWLADRIVEFDLQIIENIASRFPGQIQGLGFTDDWGTQRDTFISPRLWEAFFKPRYQKIFDLCHQVGWHIWMHSCGKINKFIPGLIEIRLDLLNLEQPHLLGIEEIGEKFSGRIAFATGVDIQNTLPFGTPQEIRAEAQKLMQCWGTERGGLVAQDDENDQDLGTPIEKKKISLEAFLEFDRWRT